MFLFFALVPRRLVARTHGMLKPLTSSTDLLHSICTYAHAVSEFV